MRQTYIDNYKYMDDITREHYKDVVKSLAYNAIVVQRLDWLLSGDEGQETFHNRLSHDLHNQEPIDFEQHHD